MDKKLEVGIIGLGKFGQSLGKTMTEMGHRVVALDCDTHKVNRLQNVLTMVYAGDGTDRETLEQLRFKDFDRVVVCAGSTLEVSILATMCLQDIGVKDIIVKSQSDEHSRILRHMGVRWLVQPEVDSAHRVAHRIATPGFLDFLPLGEGMLARSLKVDKWQGKTLIDLELTKNKVIVVAKTPAGQDNAFQYVPQASEPLNKGDVLIVVGHKDSVSALQP